MPNSNVIPFPRPYQGPPRMTAEQSFQLPNDPQPITPQASETHPDLSLGELDAWVTMYRYWYLMGHIS